MPKSNEIQNGLIHVTEKAHAIKAIAQAIKTFPGNEKNMMLLHEGLSKTSESLMVLAKLMLNAMLELQKQQKELGEKVIEALKEQVDGNIPRK